MKQMTKQSIAMLLCLAVMLSMAVPSAFAVVEYGADTDNTETTYFKTFSDVPETHWAYEYIEELVERGAISGYPDGKFRPDNVVTREEFAKIMVAAAGLTASTATKSSFSDVPLTRWSSPFIETAKAYMTAYSNTATGAISFKPEDGALREDIAVAIVKLKGYDSRLADLSMLQSMFSDVDAISSAAQPYVALAVENGLISGYSDDTFRGQSTITRAEVAAILWRAFQYGNDEKVVVDDVNAETNATDSKTEATETTEPKTSENNTAAEDTTAETSSYTVETLTRVSGEVRSLTVNGNDELYYIQNNKVMKLVEGKTTILMDGDSMTDEISDRALLVDQWGVEEDDEDYAKYIAGGDVVSFDGYTIAKNAESISL